MNIGLGDDGSTEISGRIMVCPARGDGIAHDLAADLEHPVGRFHLSPLLYPPDDREQIRSGDIIDRGFSDVGQDKPVEPGSYGPDMSIGAYGFHTLYQPFLSDIGKRGARGQALGFGLKDKDHLIPFSPGFFEGDFGEFPQGPFGIQFADTFPKPPKLVTIGMNLKIEPPIIKDRIALLLRAQPFGLNNGQHWHSPPPVGTTSKNNFGARIGAHQLPDLGYILMISPETR